jgi:hypothetical protein
MRSVALGIALGFGLAAAGSGAVWAFECPARIKEANEAIAKAEAKAPNNPDLAMAKRWVAEAQKAHQDGAATKSATLHYDSAALAKAAKLLADKVGM